MTKEEHSRESERLNLLAKQAREFADHLHTVKQKQAAVVQHDVARLLEGEAERHADLAKLNFRVI